MRVIDEAVWQEQQREIRESGELGERFLEFFKFWTDAAESLIDREITLPHALSLSLKETFANLGDIPSWALGQMLVLMSGHWVYRDDLSDALTPIEMQLMLECLQMEIDKNQESAKLAEEDEGEVQD